MPVSMLDSAQHVNGDEFHGPGLMLRARSLAAALYRVRHGSGNPTRRSIGCASAGRILSTHHQNRPLNAWHSLGVKEPHRRQSIHSSYRHC
jgi:hypothetical protein